LKLARKIAPLFWFLNQMKKHAHKECKIELFSEIHIDHVDLSTGIGYSRKYGN